MARGFNDAGVAELADTVNTLSVGVDVAVSRPGVVDAELSDGMRHFDITPGQPAHFSAIRAAEEWAESDEQDEVAKALHQDANDGFLEKVGNKFVLENSLSDDEPEPDSMEDAESVGSRGQRGLRRTRSCLRRLVL